MFAFCFPMVSWINKEIAFITWLCSIYSDYNSFAWPKDCVATVIENLHLLGISGGEKRRDNISLEI